MHAWILVFSALVLLRSPNLYGMDIEGGSSSTYAEHSEYYALKCGSVCSGICGGSGIGLGIMIARSCVQDPVLMIHAQFVGGVVGFCLFATAGFCNGYRLGRDCSRNGDENNES